MKGVAATCAAFTCNLLPFTLYLLKVENIPWGAGGITKDQKCHGRLEHKFCAGSSCLRLSRLLGPFSPCSSVTFVHFYIKHTGT